MKLVVHRTLPHLDLPHPGLPHTSPTYDNFSSREESENRVRIALAHITGDIFIKRIHVTHLGNKDRIDIEWEPQGSTKAIDYTALIREAIDLRGDLSIVSLDCMSGTASPWEMDTFDDEWFSHESSWSECAHEEAFSAPPSQKIVKVPGLHIKEETPQGINYSVHPIFARYLANTPSVCAKLKNQIVLNVQLEFIESVFGKCVYTGNIAITTQSGALVLKNAYNKLAEIFFNSTGQDSLKEEVLKDTLKEMMFELRHDGTSKISLRYGRTGAVLQAEPEIASESVLDAGSQARAERDKISVDEIINKLQSITGIDTGWKAYRKGSVFLLEAGTTEELRCLAKMLNETGACKASSLRRADTKQSVLKVEQIDVSALMELSPSASMRK